jgi:YebC/PmpR family DNA-binding regulatory protein
MSGHSKWSTIKHKKAAQDSKRGKVFGQISKMIRVAVKESSNGDPDQNPALRVALEKARAANMPKENIKRAIEKGLGKSIAGVQFEEIVYEGYGPGGVGVMLTVVTDNRNRTGSEIRNIFEKTGGSLGGPGSVAYMVEMLPNGSYQVKVPLPVEEEHLRQKVLTLIENLEAHDDVEQVIHNMAS